MAHVSVERRGRVVIVRFDRGDRANALSNALMRELTDVARSLEDDLDISAIVLTGGPEVFSLGFDLRDKDLVRLNQELADLFYRSNNADKRGVRVLYPALKFDIEAVIAQKPDLVIVSATGADSVLQHQAELVAQGIPAIVVNYSNQRWQDIAAALGRATGLEANVVDS